MSNSSSHTPSNLLGEIAQLQHLSSQLGMESSYWLHLTNNRQALSNLAEYLKLGCPKVKADGTVVTSTRLTDFNLARMILRDDFITPDIVASVYGIKYTNEQLLNFANTLPDLETLIWLHWNRFMLAAGPSTDLNLLNILALDRSMFYCEKNGRCWFEGPAHTFSRTDMVSGGQWLILRKNDLPGSRAKRWHQQLRLVTGTERIPNVAEAAYGITLYRRVYGVYLLPNFHVRTSSIGTGRRHVCIGDNDKTGLDIDDYWGTYSYNSMGVLTVLN